MRNYKRVTEREEYFLLDKVEDGFNYFDFRMEELKTDDKVYIKAFMEYIELLECKVDRMIIKNK